MRYCDKRKLVFFFPSRTGSTTFDYLLGEWGAKNYLDEARHIHPSDAVKKYPEVADYKKYGFFRNPMDRFISIVKHTKRYPSPRSESLHVTEYYNFFDKRFFGTQTKALEGCELLDFDNFESEITKVAGMFGFGKPIIPKSNSAAHLEFVPDQRTIDFVAEFFADDFKLGEQVLGKKYNY